MSIPSDKHGPLRNQVFYYNPAGDNADVDMTSQFLKFIVNHKILSRFGHDFDYMPTRKVSF
jgi:hypothetical protein